MVGNWCPTGMVPRYRYLLVIIPKRFLRICTKNGVLMIRTYLTGTILKQVVQLEKPT